MLSACQLTCDVCGSKPSKFLQSGSHPNPRKSNKVQREAPPDLDPSSFWSLDPCSGNVKMSRTSQLINIELVHYETLVVFRRTRNSLEPLKFTVGLFWARADHLSFAGSCGTLWTTLHFFFWSEQTGQFGNGPKMCGVSFALEITRAHQRSCHCTPSESLILNIFVSCLR